MNPDQVPAILRDAAERLIRPRFRLLQEGDISEKSPGELVTVADREAEDEITRRLRELDPGVPVIGEEAVADDPSLLDALYQGERCWLLDPLDGTRNFISGDPRYGVQVALVEAGQAVAAWILHPEFGTIWQAERGSGTTRNGKRITTSAGPDRIADVRGVVFTKFMSDDERADFEALPVAYVQGDASLAASIDYPAMIEGNIDFVRWSRLMPWDHAPGTLVLTEAGGVAWRLDATPYRADATGTGIIAARTEATWHLVNEQWTKPV
jgi:fructose-1,6-bisphosphatase/inositol monophosphatase family enzyme